MNILTEIELIKWKFFFKKIFKWFMPKEKCDCKVCSKNETYKKETPSKKDKKEKQLRHNSC
tara:strand:- start:3646 stop:3828 length:183 start_codon:yes stop_codon:yes gene_type:complete